MSKHSKSVPKWAILKRKKKPYISLEATKSHIEGLKWVPQQRILKGGSGKKKKNKFSNLMETNLFEHTSKIKYLLNWNSTKKKLKNTLNWEWKSYLINLYKILSWKF